MFGGYRRPNTSTDARNTLKRSLSVTSTRGTLRRPLSSLRKNRFSRHCGYGATAPRMSSTSPWLVNRAPQIMSGAVDLHENLVEVPFVAGAGSPTT